LTTVDEQTSFNILVHVPFFIISLKLFDMKQKNKKEHSHKTDMLWLLRMVSNKCQTVTEWLLCCYCYVFSMYTGGIFQHV